MCPNVWFSKIWSHITLYINYFEIVPLMTIFSQGTSLHRELLALDNESIFKQYRNIQHIRLASELYNVSIVMAM